MKPRLRFVGEVIRGLRALALLSLAGALLLISLDGLVYGQPVAPKIIDLERILNTEFRVKSLEEGMADVKHQLQTFTQYAFWVLLGVSGLLGERGVSLVRKSKTTPVNLDELVEQLRRMKGAAE